MSSIHILFDGPPGPVAGRFVEVEDETGKSISVGQWRERSDGFWELVIERGEQAAEPCARCSGTGAVDTAFSGSDPVCSNCDGDGSLCVHDSGLMADNAA